MTSQLTVYTYSAINIKTFLACLAHFIVGGFLTFWT